MCVELLLLLLLASCLFVEGSTEGSYLEPLQQIPQLSYAQLSLLASNATARCSLMPQLCNWQLHLYEGHGFPVELPTSTVGTSSTTSTTVAPQMPAPLIFAIPGLNNPQQLLIYAQVEPETPRPKRGRSRRRRPEKKVLDVARLREAYVN